MKIGVVSYICNPHSGARAPIDLAIALSKRHFVTFYAFDFNKDHQIVELMSRAGVKVVLLKKSRTRLMGSLFDIVSFIKIVRRSGHQVLTTHTIVSLLIACWLSGVPIVGCYYGTQFNVLGERFRRQNWLVRWLNRPLNWLVYVKGLVLARLPYRLVAISEYCVNEAAKLYRRRSVCIYLGNSAVNFPKLAVKYRSDQKIRLLTVSRITPYKQFERIIEVKKRLKIACELLIVGSSPRSGYLQDLRAICDKDSKVLLNASDLELSGYYSHCDIYLTADKYLFFGLPVLEAAYFGKPAIALEYGAARELIDHGKTGYVAKNDDQMLRYLTKLISDQRLRDRLGRQARIKAEDWSWERCAKEWEKVMIEVTRANG